jgi:hypothetical protein
MDPKSHFGQRTILNVLVLKSRKAVKHNGGIHGGKGGRKVAGDGNYQQGHGGDADGGTVEPGVPNSLIHELPVACASIPPSQERVPVHFYLVTEAEV